MSTALPRPARPSISPPSIALPALPVAKTRKSTNGLSTSFSKSTPTTPRSGLRAPSASLLPPAMPTPAGARSVSGVNSAGKTIRKTVSINSFPQPPRADGRISSLPPSPLSTSAPSRKLRTPTTPTYQLSNGTPSFLNGTAEGKSISRPAATRNSDGLISVASPPQSRSSSAQDSYSTSATQYDDVNDAAPPRPETSAGGKGPKGDGKGNVIVSVRVRPDAAGSDNKSDSEFFVDGRKSLIAYRGKEGGDYYYGKGAEKLGNLRDSH